MSTVVWITLGAMLGVLSPWLILRAGRARAAANPASGTRRATIRSAPERPRNPFAAVSIRPGIVACCEAATKLQGQRFLCMSAPSLPLADCNEEKCECRYAHHADRRGNRERRSGWSRFGGFNPTTGRKENRSGQERRTGE